METSLKSVPVEKEIDRVVIIYRDGTKKVVKDGGLVTLKPSPDVPEDLVMGLDIFNIPSNEAIPFVHGVHMLTSQMLSTVEKSNGTK